MSIHQSVRVCAVLTRGLISQTSENTCGAVLCIGFGLKSGLCTISLTLMQRCLQGNL